MRKILLDNRVLPRWIIFLIDLVLASWSFVLAYFISENFEFPHILRGHFFVYTNLYVVLCIPVFFLFKVHTGLIRYSNMRDMLRIFSAILTATLLYSVVIKGIVEPYFNFYSLKVREVLLVNFFVGSSLLIFLRIAAKSTYQYFHDKLSKKDKTHVLIYGSDDRAVLVKQALERSATSKFVIVGFIDTDRSKLNSLVEQKKVYHFKDLPRLKATRNIDKLLLMNDRLGERDKQVVIDRCLRLDIQVVTAPTPDKWLSGTIGESQIKNLRIEDLLQRKPIEIDNARVKADLFNKRVLVTGAAGSIGSEIVRQVLSYRPKVLILCDNAESPLHEMQLEVEETYPEIHCEIVISDVRNPIRMERLFRQLRPQVVYHAAAYKHVPLMENNPCEAISTNVKGTRIVADLAVKYGAERFVMISTDKAVNPTNVMGTTKRIAEIYTQSLNNAPFNKKTRFITTRFGNVLGSNGSVIPRFRSQIEKGGPITVTHPEITRYFMTIPEAVQLVLEAGTMGNGGEIFVFDMGKPVKIVNLARKMIKLAGIQPGMIDIVYTGLRPGEKLYEELLNSEELTLPTHHEKISIAQVINHDYVDATVAIDKLLAFGSEGDNVAVVKQMKTIVPEFVSKNSPYEALDAESEMI
ncbi:polysaccharide biosynthesis protein [Olivibacter sp. SDN3]|uniref:polysaccharide biosynthesis protein n=1 Tax=Olivibacter sp. SDN3 TaxID=2764720 RepID=UPI00165127FC|nr:nucleoside-diphosphate sugar epimerase/dehydratase [Olivibacter sp. SDN3]QNL51606.1 polysaccharide biosynthesis protein [Olivibacter sp. SDN3]